MLAATGLFLAACLDQPSFSTVDVSPTDLPGGSLSTDPAHPNMVFVPGLAIDIPGAGAPSSASEREDDNGNGKGKGKKDAGAPPPPDAGATPPPDAGATPPAPPPGTPGPTGTRLEVAGFWIDVTEVTADAFRSCVDAGKCTASGNGEGCTMQPGLGSHPVNCVTLEQARTYCASQRKRLVMTDEWTAAAMGADLRPYPWGTALPAGDRLNACGSECVSAGMYPDSDGQISTAPVGTFPLGRTPDGVQDLAGNVAEWVEGGSGPTARGASFQDVDRTSAAPRSARVTVAGVAVGFRCAVDR